MSLNPPLRLSSLPQDLEHIGSKGSVAHVRAGYFRNYLYPQKLAIYATKQNLTKLEQSELVPIPSSP